MSTGKQTNKNAKKLKCKKCAFDITNKEYMKCSICDYSYHLDCTNVSLKRFFLMAKNSKNTWQCRGCLDTASMHDNNLPSTSKIESIINSTKKHEQSQEREQDMPNISINKVTMRKKVKDRLSLSSLHTPDSSLDESTEESLSNSVQSMPNPSENLQISDLKDTIEILTTQLTSAHDEIAKLNIDITNLTKTQLDLERQIDTLKRIVNDRNITTSRQSTPKLKKKKSNLQHTLRSKLKEMLHGSTENINKEDDNDRQTELHEVNISEGLIVDEEKTPQASTPLKLRSKREIQDNYIYMYGGSQCAGLAPTLLYMDQVEKYQITSSVEPDATTQHITHDIKYQRFSENDKIILSVGEHDNNPIDIVTTLNNALKYLGNCVVFILGIRNSKYMNNDVLNYILRSLCQRENHKFIEIPKANKFSKKNLLTK